MMSAFFFHFQHTLNRLFNNCITLHLYYNSSSLNMKGEGGGAQIDPSPQKNLSSKSPAFLGLRRISIQRICVAWVSDKISEHAQYQLLHKTTFLLLSRDWKKSSTSLKFFFSDLQIMASQQIKHKDTLLKYIQN